MYNVHYVFVLFIVLYQYIIILFMYKKYSKSCFSFLKDAVDLYSTERKITLIRAKEKTAHWEAYQYPNFKVWVNSMGLGDISKLQRFCQGTNEGMGHNCRMNNINCCHQISQKFSSWHIFFGSPPPPNSIVWLANVLGLINIINFFFLEWAESSIKADLRKNEMCEHAHTRFFCSHTLWQLCRDLRIAYLSILQHIWIRSMPLFVMSALTVIFFNFNHKFNFHYLRVKSR